MVANMFNKNVWKPLYPFESQWLHLPDGHRMHYVDEGQGEPIVCVHGNPTWSFFYRELIKEMKGTNRVIAMDHIGCGLSDKPQNYSYTLNTHIDNLERLILQLNLQPFTLVVHDWGGAIGMGFANRHPELVKRILFLNTAAYRSQLMPGVLKLARCPFIGKFLIKGLNAFVLAAIFTCTTKPMGAYTCSGYLTPYDSWHNRVAVYNFVKDIPMDPSHISYDTLAEIENGLSKFKDIPKAFVWGNKDYVFTPRFLERWKMIYPDSDVRQYDDVGHYVMEDASERVLRSLKDLLQK